MVLLHSVVLRVGGISPLCMARERESSLCKCSILIILGGRPYSLPNKNGPGLTPGYKHRKVSKALITNHQKKTQPASPRDAMTSSKAELPGEVKSDPAALMASLHLMPTPVPNPEIKYTKVCLCFILFSITVTFLKHSEGGMRTCDEMMHLISSARKQNFNLEDEKCYILVINIKLTLKKTIRFF